MGWRTALRITRLRQEKGRKSWVYLLCVTRGNSEVAAFTRPLRGPSSSWNRIPATEVQYFRAGCNSGVFRGGRMGGGKLGGGGVETVTLHAWTIERRRCRDQDASRKSSRGCPASGNLTYSNLISIRATVHYFPMIIPLSRRHLHFNSKWWVASAGEDACDKRYGQGKVGKGKSKPGKARWGWSFHEVEAETINFTVEYME